ncbi:hypothetical protein CLIB1444_01S19218 [[Candida] jaroonii]|uniref:Uncharacterized protein n=1 Tax=[Candida] jaroonii TaxID=467808 RepID=A0ACA9Y216_9ASCO|nr:hypothetical protein CLIB1444_01S19218 [[Candida] jaroonii]
MSLSYKKPRNDSRSTSPQVAQAELPATPTGSNSPVIKNDSTRKVSSRRKALQEFYHLQKQQNQEVPTIEVQSEAPQTTDRKQSITNGIDFDDAESFKAYVKNTPIEDILKLRNTITGDLNSHDSEKKAIIYDNYYELIKLNDTLKNISNPKPTNIMDTSEKLDHNAILTTLKELETFVDDNKVFNNPFPKVLDELQKDYDGADMASTASVDGIIESDNIADSIDRTQLIKEVNLLLSGPIQSNDKVSQKIESMIKSLKPSDELLINQLKSIQASL